MVAVGNVSVLKLAGFTCDKIFIIALFTLYLMNDFARGAAINIIRSVSEPKLNHTCPLHLEVDFYKDSCKCDILNAKSWQDYLAEIIGNLSNSDQLPVVSASVTSHMLQLRAL